MSSSDAWREVLPGLHHLGERPDAIVEYAENFAEWRWRCPHIARGGVEVERGRAMRAARRALREAAEREGEG